MSGFTSGVPEQFLSAQVQFPQVANKRPVLAIPVCTSSAMNKALYFLHSSLAFFRYPSSGTITPASPCIGSTMNPAMFGFAFNAVSSASALLYSITSTPGR